MQNIQSNNKIGGLVKADIYKLILTYSSDVLVKGNVFFIDRNMGRKIAKDSEKMLKGSGITDGRLRAMKAGLLAVRRAEELLNNVSHEMLTYISLDFLLNVEEDTSTRVRFGHINTTAILEEISRKYKKELNLHYKFFSSIVDKL